MKILIPKHHELCATLKNGLKTMVTFKCPSEDYILEVPNTYAPDELFTIKYTPDLQDFLPDEYPVTIIH